MEMQHPAEIALSELTGERTLAVAESLTSGALAARLMSIPGSSRYFQGGVIAYSNEAKQKVLGVSNSLLSEHGPVSEECALHMARSVRSLFGSSIGVSTTGIAGPVSPSEDKPVGLVYVAITADEYETCTRNVWSGDRLENIARTIEEGLWALYRYLKG